MKWKHHEEAASGTGSRDLEAELIDKAVEYAKDPYRFVMWAWPWGETGGPLETMNGPMRWQTEHLVDLAQALHDPSGKGQFATASGKGIGKSGLVGMVANTMMTTRDMCRGVVTAGTETQLRTKTWPEIAKWHRMCLYSHWWEFGATSMQSTMKQYAKEWRLDYIPWSATNKEAFAGLHNFGSRIVVLYDEASQIDDVIWETTDGIMTDRDTEVIWCVYGNPTRNVGRFKECFGRFRHRWRHRQIDSRKVEITDKEKLDETVRDWGEESDYVKVNVRGMFPSVSSMQFIPGELVTVCMKLEAKCALDDPLVLGVDVARNGDAQTVLAIRKGRDARTIPWVKMRTADTMQIATRIADLHQQYKFDAIHIDGGGVGGGVVDRCRQLNLPNIREVQFGSKADRGQTATDATKYANKRAEMWGIMREMLRAGTAIPDDRELEVELPSVMFAMNRRDEIQLEAKEDLQKRGEASPDNADALALTYAYPVFPSRNAGGPHHDGSSVYMAKTDYDETARI